MTKFFVCVKVEIEISKKFNNTELKDGSGYPMKHINAIYEARLTTLPVLFRKPSDGSNSIRGLSYFYVSYLVN